MASTPSELSLAEIREFMLINRGKVTNHALVKHFKKFLTHPQTQNEARKNFKTYVNILATSKTEGTEKYLLLRKRYYNECPTEEAVSALNAISPTSPDAKSISDFDSPSRVPPPYRPPPEPTTPTSPIIINFPTTSSVVPINGPDRSSNMHFRDCIDEFKNAITILKHDDPLQEIIEQKVDTVPSIPPRKRNSVDKTILVREASIDIPDINQSPRNRAPLTEDQQNIIGLLEDADTPTKISVKSATEKFNRIASEEEEAAKIASPPGKIAKKNIKNTDDKENLSAESLIGHAKSKEWMVSAARANYQELAKLALEFPELTRFKDSNTGYTALHWAAKHGNEDVVKLIAGKHKANVNAQTNGGYTPLHLAMQFGRDNIFELLCNTYKADRDLLDWSGRKALDYRKQKTSVSPSTFSKIKAKKKHSEKDLGFLRIGSLNVRVKKTTEAFSNFLGVGSNHNSSNHPTNPMIMAAAANNNHPMNRAPLNARTSAPPNSTYFEKIHKNWGSADNIPHDDASNNGMPPPKYGVKKHRTKRGAGDFNLPIPPNRMHSHSTPTTPNQTRAPIGIVQEHPHGEKSGDSDSDSAYGFDSNWNGGNKPKDVQRPTYI